MTAFAQKTAMTGVVLDADNQEPLIGVTVMEKGTTNGTMTDIDGRFSISVNSNATLVFSYVGYTNQEVSVKGEKNIVVKMASTSVALDEMVVIGYGVQRKSDITGSISSVSGKDINDVPVSSALQALQGKAAGVNIIQNTGAPGSNTTIKIRGTGTVNDADPLYVVDGFIVDNGIIKECEDGIRKHILDTKDVLLRGKHNFENIATALAATKTLVDQDIAIDAVKEFKAVEHRLEFVREIDGVKWYNDSVSSSPTRTIAGLNSFDEDIVLIAGGYDKNLDYTPLAKPILKKVKKLILLGATSGKIFEAVKREEEKEGKNIDIYMCDTLEETVNLAKKHAKKGEIVLFSPASASFDMFKNFADRGNKFKNLVNNL